VIGAAYTNNDGDANTGTTLFDIETGGNRDRTVVQSPTNSGQLAATGKLFVDVTGAVGFEIYSSVRNGTTVGLRPPAATCSGSLGGACSTTGLPEDALSETMTIAVDGPRRAAHGSVARSAPLRRSA